MTRATPTQLKIMTGNPGKRPLNKDEPVLSRFLPDPPDCLSEKALSGWHEIGPMLYEMGVLTKSDAGALVMLCETLVEYFDAKRELREAGSAYYRVETQSGSFLWKTHPAMATISDCDRRIRAWYVEFGMTPAARTKIKTVGINEAEDPADKYFRRTG